MLKKTTLFQTLVRRRAIEALVAGLLIVVLTVPGLGMPAAAETLAVTATMTADPTTVAHDGIVEYTVSFDNTGGAEVTLNSIIDHLPTGFAFQAMAAGTDPDIGNPSVVGSTLTWTGPFTVPGDGSPALVFRVKAEAVPSTTPYTNNIEAAVAADGTATAQADVTVSGPMLTCTKTPSTLWPTVGSLMNYSVTIHNGGTSAATISRVEDTLPGQFSFVDMVSGSLPDPAPGNPVVWTGSFGVPDGGDLSFTYQVRVDGTVDIPQENNLRATYDGGLVDSCKVAVYIGRAKAFLPFIKRTYTPPPPPPKLRLAFETKPGDQWEIYAVNADGTDRLNISNRLMGDLNPDWAPGGDKIAWEHFGGNADIYVANADGSNAANVTNSNGDDKDPDWSPDGNKIVFRSNRDGRWDIFVMNPDGSGQQKLTGARPCQSTMAKWSPDGTKIGFICGLDENAEVYVMNADGSNQRGLTDDGDQDSAINWSPDSTRLIYARIPADDDSEIWVADVNSGTRTKLTDNSQNDYAPMYSPDGTKIALGHEYDGIGQVAVMNADGSGMTNVSNSGYGNFVPQWSPDGTKIAFLSNRDGNYEVYVMNANGSNQTRLTNTAAKEINFDWMPITD